MIFHSLYTRIAFTFAAILLCFGGVLGVVSYGAARAHQQEVTQTLSRGLATHIAEHNGLNASAGLERAAANELFHMLMAVNPSIEVYLLDRAGAIVMHSAPPGHVTATHVALAPIQAFLAGGRMPILGDNPRNPARKVVFSVAPIERAGVLEGYLYVVLTGEEFERMSESAGLGYALSAALWLGLAVLACALGAGLVIFHGITRRVNALAARVDAFSQTELADAPGAENGNDGKDEIGRLVDAFGRMSHTISSQIDELRQQDGLRRELVANVSHDLRTPLTSMQNYLETMLAMADRLSASQRQEYLERAVRQSQGVARLVQQLFELARLECEEGVAELEPFCVSELLQDIAHKTGFAAHGKGVRLMVVQPGEPMRVVADIGLIERVITNLIDNAIRCTAPGGEVRLEAVPARGTGGDMIEISVSDTGHGIANEHLAQLFERDSPLRRRGTQSHAGLGLLIVKRILTLHGTHIVVDSTPGRGTCFRFALPCDREADSGRARACV
jgi:signal transduction histidine kinase